MDNKKVYQSLYGQVLDGRLFKGTHFIRSETNDPPKRNNSINIFLISPKILLYFAF